MPTPYRRQRPEYGESMCAVSGKPADTRLDATFRTYAGLFMVALATLTYEILLTRIFSVTTQYHFAFAAVSVAMFGMTVGAVVVFRCTGYFSPDRIKGQIASSALLFSLTSVAAFVAHLVLPFVSGGAFAGFGALAPTYVLVSVPFVFSGICVCLCLTRLSGRVGRLYASDLAGAALGCVALLGILKVTDGPTAVIVVAFLGALGSVLLAGDVASVRLRRYTMVCALVLGLAATFHTVLVWRQSPILRLYWVKGSQETTGSHIYEKWNSFSRITVDGNPEDLFPPVGWGLSRTLDRKRKHHELGMFIDSTAGTSMTGYTGDPGEIEHLKYDIVNIAHFLRRRADVLVIGSGGGRDILAALAFDQSAVVGVEINEEIVRAVTKRFGDFTGHLDRDPRISFVIDEARSYVARQQKQFDIIQISLIDTWAATAAGAMVLTENSLYTVEAWTTFMSHLKPGGVLTVSRWYYGDRPPVEIYRLTALASTALVKMGVKDPRSHILLVRLMRRKSSRRPAPDGMGTLILSRDPFSIRDLEILRSAADQLGFEVVQTPTVSIDKVLFDLTGADTLGPTIDSYPLNISAPTDDSPFFFHMMRFHDIYNRSLLREWGKEGADSFQIKAVAVLGTLLLVVTVLCMLCIIAPLWLSRDSGVQVRSLPLTLYFAGIGTGFMLVEISQMQRLIVFLGHPAYALSVVLFCLLLSSGLGSLLSDRIRAPQFRVASSLVIGGLLVALFLFGLLTPLAADTLAGSATPVRVITAGGILCCLGLPMGTAFPLGMRLAATRASSLMPWLWGINGAASVFASVLGMAIALTAGISAAFWTGLACYVVSAVSFFWMNR